MEPVYVWIIIVVVASFAGLATTALGTKYALTIIALAVLVGGATLAMNHMTNQVGGAAVVMALSFIPAALIGLLFKNRKSRRSPRRRSL